MFTAGFAGLWGQFLVMLECFNHPVSIWRIYLAPVYLYSTCASALKSKGLKNTDDVLAYFWLAPFRAEREGHCVPVALWDGSVWGGRGQHRHSERLVWCGFTYQCPHDRWKARTPGPLGLRAPPLPLIKVGKCRAIKMLAFAAGQLTQLKQVKVVYSEKCASVEGRFVFFFKPQNKQRFPII